MKRFYRQFISKDDLCFDVGANIGERTGIFLKLGARVVSVEPQKKCFEILQKTFNDRDGYTGINAAAGSEEKEDILRICDEADECSTLSGDFVATYSEVSHLHWTKSENVRVLTLDILIAQYGIPHFCKIDVEGYESQVLNGLSFPLPYISIEFNRHFLHDTRKALERINSLGNYRYNFIRYEKMKLVLEQWVPASSFYTNLDKWLGNDLTGEIIAEKIT